LAIKNGYSFLGSIPDTYKTPALKLKALLKNNKSRKYFGG
jgi:hypothetical protein